MTKEREKMIELLRNDEEYYNGAGRGYLSVSHIDMMMKTPEKYIAFIQGHWTPPHKSVFTIGQALHTLVLEGEGEFSKRFFPIDCSTRNTKIYKEFPCQESEKLLLKEYNMIQRLQARLLKLGEYDETVFNMCSPFIGKTEEPNIMDIDGVLWKMKADKVTDTAIIDLKSTSDITGFQYAAKKYNYDAQASLYSKAFGVDMEFVAIDKNTEEVTIADCSDEFLAGGWYKIEEATAFYKEFIQPALDGQSVDFAQFRNHITL